MRVEYIVQPNTQLGIILANLLNEEPIPQRVVFVSAFTSLQTIMRFKNQFISLRNNMADVKFVLGIDMDGTSQEALTELLSWDIEVWIVKNRVPGHTFHPKIYAFEWDDRAEIIIGSNNLREGGLYKNYEGSARVIYALPADLEAYTTAHLELDRFLNPTGPVCRRLDAALLHELIERREILDERESRYSRRTRRTEPGNRTRESPFGTEEIQTPPPLPTELVGRLVRGVRRRRQTTRRQEDRNLTNLNPRIPLPEDVENILEPVAFYMTLPTLQGTNIPGEARIPLEAIELAQDFWGWQEQYTRDVSPRDGQDRVYWNWRPLWKIWDVEENVITIQEVRMYMYENSSDFRFYARPLINAGADLGDIVRIRRLYGADADYECQLAKQGSEEYEQWIQYCTEPVRNSTRRFGYV